MGVLLGQPRDGQGWEEVHAEALKVLKEASIYYNNRVNPEHRRGIFPSVAHGVSFGGGQEVRCAGFFRPN